MDQQSSPQPEQRSRPGSAQQLAGESAAPATSPVPRWSPHCYTSQDSFRHQLFKWASYPGLAHHKYNYQLPKLLVPTFPLCLVLSLQKIGSTPVATIRRCVTKVTTLTQDRTPTRTPVHNAPSQTGSIKQWTIPHKVIWTNNHIHQ